MSSDRNRTYWLVEPCRIRRVDQSVAIEKADGTTVRIPITDVADIIATAPVDINTAVISLLSRHGVTIHLLDHYGNYAGSLTPAENTGSGYVVLRQAALATNADQALTVARRLVVGAARDVTWSVGAHLLAEPLSRLEHHAFNADSIPTLMGAEGTFRRTAWAVIDQDLPGWLRLDGRTRRPPSNAGNAFISFANGIVYSRCVAALRLTPLNTTIGFLHATTDRRRHTLALDLAEVFKPLLSERILLRMAHRKELSAADFEHDANAACLSAGGRKKVIVAFRDELATTIHHRQLRRKVSYEHLIYLEALKILRLVLEGAEYKPLRPWW